MAWEIERKFLLKDDSWRETADEGVLMMQGYLAGGSGSPVVRIRIAGDRAFLTIKGKTSGITRSEFEYLVPLEDARFMLENLCGTRIIEKRRYHCGRWEIDEYFKDNQGLFTAEIELASPDETFEFPPWLGREISGDPAYTNGALSRKPWKTWEDPV